jgi:hypothetical protein
VKLLHPRLRGPSRDIAQAKDFRRPRIQSAFSAKRQPEIMRQFEITRQL